MKAEIITIGDELLNGFTVDTNSAWMGQRLLEQGIEVARKMAISDKKEAIFAALNMVIAPNTLVLVTGGLGPTNDDITKHCFCEYFGTLLVMNDEAYKNTERFVLQRGGTMNALNQSQAMVPKDARFIPNNNGTASGMWFEKDGCVIVAMPGVPHEMKQMMTESVLPMVEAHFSRQTIVYRSLLSVGIPESQLAIYLTDWETSLPTGVKLAYLPSPGQVILRLSCVGNDKAVMESMLSKHIERIPPVVAQKIISYDGESMAEIVARLLRQSKQSVSTAESCTGGSIASELTALAGSSEWFMGSVVAYSNSVKESMLAVPAESIATYGAVSEAVVCAMAVGACKRLATDWSIAVSGIAGPSGGSAEKPVGTVWIAIANRSNVVAKCFKFANSGREVVIKRSVSAALLFLIEEISKR